MNKRIKIKIGDKFNKLTVIEFEYTDKHRAKHWTCQCECGNIIHNVLTNSLTSGNTKSCGCLNKESAIKRGKSLRKLNTYDLSGEYGVGYTSNGEYFYFDLEDYNKIKEYTWRLNLNKYVFTIGWENNSPHIILMHRFILDVKNSSIIIDHKNHIPYDNKKINLRKCSNSNNCMNHKIESHNVSGITGVSWDKSRNKWVVHININKKMKFIGRFEIFEEAVQARKDAEEKYYKEFQYHLEEDKYNKVEIK